MNLRWLFGNYADPEFNLTRQQQREVTWLAHRRHLRSSTLALTTAALVGASYLLLGCGWDPMAGVLAGAGIQPARWISMTFICIVSVLFACWMYRYIYIKPVRRAMRDLGYDVCVNCGYRLQGLGESTTNCPECGHPREAMPKKGTDETASRASSRQS